MNRSVEQIPNTRVNEVASNLDAVSRAAGPFQGWFRGLDGKQRKRELDFREERRLERTRIAGELHDTLLQGFLGTSLVVGATLREMAEDSPARASLNRAARLMQLAIEEGRAALQGLRTSVVAPGVVAPGSLEREFSDLLRENDQQKKEQYSGVRDQEIRAALDQHWAASDANDFETEHRIYHEDAVLEYPQSGERTRGRRNIQNQRASQPSKKRFTVRRIIGGGDLWVTEFILTYDGKPSYTVSIMEFRGDKVARETQYFADPFVAPAWRAQWVERMDT
jgi:ketosteroid isomerase-like protein